MSYSIEIDDVFNFKCFVRGVVIRPNIRVLRLSRISQLEELVRQVRVAAVGANEVSLTLLTVKMNWLLSMNEVVALMRET